MRIEYVDKPAGFPNAWGTGTVPTPESVAADLKSGLCTGDEKAYYKYGNGWEHGDYTCVETPPQESFYKRGKYEVYFPSFFRDQKVVHRTGRAACDAMKTNTCVSHPDCASDVWAHKFNKDCYREWNATVPVVKSNINDMA